MGRLVIFLLLNCMICLSTENEADQQRLPYFAIPRSYELDLKLDPGFNDSFYGAVKIIICARKNADKIVLHASDSLNLHSVSVKSVKNNTRHEELAFYWNNTKQNELLSVYLNKTMDKGKLYVMKFKYTGLFVENNGLFIRSYESENGIENYLISNNFESRFARRAFPCFDEPRFKANFSIIVRHPIEYNALSNMDIRQSFPLRSNKSWVYTAFNPTPKMATYLVGILVSKLKSFNNFKHGPKIYDKLVEIYSYNNSEYQNNLTIVAAQKYLMEMERYLDFPYQLPKLTIAFVPNYATLGMENWGLIIFDEEAGEMLKEGCDGFSEILYIATIGHEITHMWFGNEATLYDWNSLWINEGFANYFQYKSWEFINEYGDFLAEEFSNYVQRAIDAEYSNGISLSSETAIKNEQIELQMLAWYYVKGGAIIRMMERTIGKTLFQQTMRNYIQTYSRRSVRSENIIEEFQNTTNYSLPVGMFESWINNEGLPLVHAYQRPNSNIVDIFQTTFNSSDELEEGTWYIPLIWTTKSNPDFTNTTIQMWLKPYENISITLDNENDWFILNIQQTGYYRVIYDDGNWKKISKALLEEDFSGIDPVTRSQLINDVFAYAKHDDHFYLYGLEILKYARYEYDYHPFRWILYHLDNILNKMRFSEYFNLYESFVLNSIENQIKIFTNTSDYRFKELKTDLLDTACKVKSDYALDYFHKYLDDVLNREGTEVYTYQLCCGLYNLDEIRWNTIENLFQPDENSIDEDFSYLQLCTNNENIIKRFYMKTIDQNSTVDPTYRLDLITYLSEIHHPRPDYLMDLMIDHFKELNEMFDVDIMKKFLKNLENQKNSVEYRDKFTIFYNKYFNSSLEYQPLKQTIEYVMAANLNNSKNTKDIDMWLIKNVQGF